MKDNASNIALNAFLQFTKAFTVCTENPIENVKLYGLNNYILFLKDIVCRNIVRQEVDGNRESKTNLVRKYTPYMDAINHYILIARETTSESKKV